MIEHVLDGFWIGLGIASGVIVAVKLWATIDNMLYEWRNR